MVHPGQWWHVRATAFYHRGAIENFYSFRNNVGGLVERIRTLCSVARFEVSFIVDEFFAGSGRMKQVTILVATLLPELASWNVLLFIHRRQCCLDRRWLLPLVYPQFGHSKDILGTRRG